jgi:glycosyltransferase involved in cell wall biosynthesis
MILAMNLAVLTHIYPADPLSPQEIPGNFLPPFLRELTRHDIAVRVLAPRASEADAFDPAIPVERFAGWGDARPLGALRLTDPRDAWRLAIFIWRGVRALNALIARERIDAVLACWAIPAGFIASFADKPYAVWGLGTDIHTSARNPLTRAFVLRALARARWRYANSHALVRSVKELSGLDCALLPNMRPLPRDVPPADFPKDRMNLLVAARLEYVKGVDVLLDALARVSPPRPRVYIAGTGTLENDLRVQVARLNLQDDVIFLGFLDARALAAALRACDAVVIPSRAESVPMIFKEGACFRVPVVATDVGDLGNLVREFDAGLVVPPGDASALADALIEMQSAPRERFTARLDELAAQFDLHRAAEKLAADLQALRQ